LQPQQRRVENIVQTKCHKADTAVRRILVIVQKDFLADETC
jgi:hypothetical protein